MRTLEVMRCVDRSRYQLSFLSLSGLTGVLDEEIAALGGTVHHLRLGPSFPWRFAGLLRRERFDVVHSHVHYFSGVIVALARLAGVTGRIAHFRNSTDGAGDGVARRVRNRVLRALLRRNATAILAVSEGAMEGSLGPAWRDDPKTEIVYNGLDLAPYASAQGLGAAARTEWGIPGEALLCIHVGRYAPAKNQAKVVEVFARLRSRRPDARLLLVGAPIGEETAGLRRRCTELGLDGVVTFAGTRADVPRLLAAADLMVFPSLWEGLPGAVLEAVAANVPVLGSDIPGVREIAARLPLVRFLPVGASDDDWAEAALQLLGEDSRGGDCGSRALAASVFSLQHCAESMVRIWEREARLVPVTD